MGIRRVVTGHSPDGKAVVASDEVLEPFPIGDEGASATIDYDIVLAGSIGLELDDGVEVTLGPGDVVVQNGTRHRWHNRGDTIARMMSVTIGAHHKLVGGSPVS